MSGLGVSFSLFGGLFAVMFCLVLGVFVFVFVKGITQWNKNNQSPRLTVSATVVAKRSDVHHHHHSDGHMMYTTSYYVTFEVESGDRMELSVSGTEYGLLAEGDRGKLSFQGTRYLGFARG